MYHAILLYIRRRVYIVLKQITAENNYGYNIYNTKNCELKELWPSNKKLTEEIKNLIIIKKTDIEIKS